MSDEDIRNVFSEADKKKVPVTVNLPDGQKLVVGEAEVVDIGEGLVHVEMNLKTDDPDDVVNLFSAGITGYSLDASGEVETKHHEYPANAPVSHRMSEQERQIRAGVSAHAHNPRQHRDGKPPWCRVCGLDAEYRTPVNHFNFGKPANPLRGE